MVALLIATFLMGVFIGVLFTIGLHPNFLKKDSPEVSTDTVEPPKNKTDHTDNSK